MDSKKAIEIINSSEKIEVLYNGTPVWLQGINGDIANVKSLETNKNIEVPVNDLVIGDKIR